MKEIQAILQKVSNFAPDEKAILATVVDVVGSGYRRPGARMLIDENGYSVGTVSGGCLEADVLERAKRVLETGESAVITYDTTADDNSVFGLSMGCRGIVRILLEAVTKESLIFNAFDWVVKNREKTVVATLVNGENNVNIGGRVFYDRLEQFDFNHLPNSFENLESLKNDCLNVYDGEAKYKIETYETDKGTAEFFIERIEPPLSLLLFGAGFDALPLIRLAKELGWRVTTIDHRAAYNNAERIPESDKIIISSSEDLKESLFNDEKSVAVIMTHNYERDRNILRRLMSSKCLYVGALGPKKRTENLLEEIGETSTGEQLAKLHAPVGLDIGADTPEEIALAIVAEIRAALSGRNGGFLRERKGSIYNNELSAR